MLADVRWLFQFVDGGDRVVLPRNAAALLVGQELVLAEPEFAGPLAGADHCRGRQEGPVEGRLPAQPVTVEYSITPLGATLSATVDELQRWARDHIGEVVRAQRRYDAAAPR